MVVAPMRALYVGCAVVGAAGMLVIGLGNTPAADAPVAPVAPASAPAGEVAEVAPMATDGLVVTRGGDVAPEPERPSGAQPVRDDTVVAPPTGAPTWEPAEPVEQVTWQEGTLECGFDAGVAIDYDPNTGWWAYCEPGMVSE